MSITKEELIKRLADENPHGVELVYIDRSDDFSERPEWCDELIRSKEGFSPSMDDIEFWENEHESEIYLIKEVLVDGEDYDDLDDDVREAARDWLHDNNKSSPIKEMLSHTSSWLAFYDLGIELDHTCRCCSNTREHRKQVESIMERFNISKDQRRKIECLTSQANGGELVIYFQVDTSDFYANSRDEKYITFTNPHIGIIDFSNGSGDVTEVECTVQLPFDRRRIRIDRCAPGYGWSKICGEFTANDYELSNKLKPDVKLLRLANDYGPSYREQREIEFEKHWKETGECSFGDMKISRHKDTEYTNNYPCGTKCKKCATFWID